MRIVFVDNLLFEGNENRPWFDLQPHLGLMSLASVATAAGHEPIIFDPKRALVDKTLSWSPSLYADIAHAIVEQAPDVVGFTALGCNFHCVTAIASFLRAQRPLLPIILGGPHATILHREILERLPCFDAIARHEAEETLAPMLAALPLGIMEGIPGVSWRAEGGASSATRRARSRASLTYVAGPYGFRLPVGLTTIRIRGRPGLLVELPFCATGFSAVPMPQVEHAHRWRMDRWCAPAGFTEFSQPRSLLPSTGEKSPRICAEVASRQFRWSLGCVDFLDTSSSSFAVAGPKHVFASTGSAAINFSSRKRSISARSLSRSLLNLPLGIRTTSSFIIGYPEETLADQCETLDMAGRLHCKPLNCSQLHLLTPEPGTALLNQHGASLRLDKRRGGFNMPRFGGDDDDLISADPELFVTHYYFPTIVPRERNVFIAALWRQLAPLSEAYALLLNHWGGSLSALMEATCLWWADTAEEGTDVPPDALARFAESVFGSEAPVVSLLRYTAACHAEPKGHHVIRAKDGISGSTRLAPGASVLRDIHDVSHLGASVLHETSAERTNLLVLPSILHSPLRVYRIDELTADLLCVLDTPGGESILNFVDEADLARLKALKIIEGPFAEGAGASAAA